MAYFADADGDDAGPDINTTPLIDVLLVLLVMLIVTIPIPLQQLDSALPPATSAPVPPPPAIRIDLEADGSLKWDGDPVPDLPTLEARLHEAAARHADASLRLHPAPATSFGRTVAVMAAIHRQGLTNLAVLTPNQGLP